MKIIHEKIKKYCRDSWEKLEIETQSSIRDIAEFYLMASLVASPFIAFGIMQKYGGIVPYSNNLAQRTSITAISSSKENPVTNLEYKLEQGE